MMRKILVVGDRHAHQVAIIGGRVYCKACSSVGRIAKAGGPRRMGYLTGVALEGDMLGLEAENFVRWSPNAHRHIACSNIPPRAGLAAQVCKPDVETHTIAIGMEFCRLRRDTRIFGTDSIRDGDSQLFTIIHEVTHFDDVFGSTDEWPGTQVSRAMARTAKQSGIARINADSLTGYIAGAKDI